jgi:CRISPR system Cascade subunit CasE
MMFISTLLIDTGRNPDRPRPGRLWLRNLYRVHQRLCMAFPSKERMRDDEHFLQPFKPKDFGNGQVHVKREDGKGFLFRVDPQRGGNVVILVLSAIEPNWDYAFHNAGYLLAAPAQVKNYDPNFGKGETLKFRLATNTTRRCSKNSKDSKGNPVDPKWLGKRIPVPFDKLKDWLIAGGKKGGFAVDEVTVQSGYIYVNKQDGKLDSKRLLSVRYEGILHVTDPDRFHKTLVQGIGPAKAFGFGLLSIAPVK